MISFFQIYENNSAQSYRNYLQMISKLFAITYLVLYNSHNGPLCSINNNIRNTNLTIEIIDCFQE